MNFPRRLPLFSLLIALAWAIPSRAQTIDSTEADTAPAGSTIITSDELRSDQNTHISVFSGNVVVVGSNFNLTCQEMTVVFNQGGKVQTITATGNVVITQPGRVSHSGQAEYFSADDKFVLTDQPNILDNKNQIFAPIITIFRTDQKMVTSGAKTKVILAPGTATAATPTPQPAGTP